MNFSSVADIADVLLEVIGPEPGRRLAEETTVKIDFHLRQLVIVPHRIGDMPLQEFMNRLGGQRVSVLIGM